MASRNLWIWYLVLLTLIPPVLGSSTTPEIENEALAKIIKRWPALPLAAFRAQVDLWELWSFHYQQLQQANRIRCTSCIDFSSSWDHMYHKLQLVYLKSKKVKIKLILQEVDLQNAPWSWFLVNHLRWPAVGPLTRFGPRDRYFFLSDEKGRPLGMMIGTELETEQQKKWFLLHTLEGDALKKKHLKSILTLWGQEGANLGFQKILLPEDLERDHLNNGRFHQWAVSFLGNVVVADLPIYYLDRQWRQQIAKNHPEVGAFRQARALWPNLFFASSRWDVVINSSRLELLTSLSEAGRPEYFKLLLLRMATIKTDADDLRVRSLQHNLGLSDLQLQRLGELISLSRSGSPQDVLPLWEMELKKIGLDGPNVSLAEFRFLWEQATINAIDAWGEEQRSTTIATYQQLPPNTRHTCVSFLQHLVELE